MANLIRTAKSGSDWTVNELLAYNIKIDTVNAATFFGNANLPPLKVSPVILNNVAMPAGPLTKKDRQFFHYLRDAIRGIGEESCVDDYAAFILRLLGYDDVGDRVIHQRKEISFVMGGSYVHARPDVCITTFTEYVLLVQEDDHFISYDDPEPRLIAGAIAAFYQNDLKRQMTGRPPLASKTFAGITMIGTAPIFYRVPITMDLLRAVVTSQYPTQVTVVQCFIPPVADPMMFREDGMVPLDNRHIILQCFEAFKQFVN